MRQIILNLQQENEIFSMIIQNQVMMQQIKLPIIKESKKYNLYNYNDAYILVRGDTTVVGASATQVVFKSCALFTKFITKLDETKKDDAEDLELVMPMYNLTEFSSNFFETTGVLWFYSKVEASNFKNNIANTGNFKPFKYEAKLLENKAAQPAQNATIAVLFKYLSNFWTSLEMPLIDC